MKPQEKLNPSNPMNSIGGSLRTPMGLGTMVQKVIHAGLNVTPMPAATRTAIKGCGGCKRRRDALNRLMANANPFARK
jgi:hypothetical protein